MNDKQNTKKPVVLMIIDGFGVAPDYEGNSISRAKTPVFDKLIRKYPTMTIRASGEEVGLSWGQMGNSEVGHLNIGAGRVYYQTLPRIDKSISSGEFLKNEMFLNAMAHVEKNGGTLHLVGLVSQGRVHSMDSHCHALLDLAKTQKCKDVVVHAFLDGRDTLYNSGIDFVASLENKMKKIKLGRIGSLSGRYYAMDRDHVWDRTQKAYNAIVSKAPVVAEDAITAVKESYKKEVYDEEFVPTTIVSKGEPVGLVKEGDSIIFFNFRPDRMRQLSKAFILDDFKFFPCKKFNDLFIVTMAEYEEGLTKNVAFPPERIEMPLAQVISEAGLTQLHIAETQKYAHVTFFINGTYEKPFEGEDRILVPSPRVESFADAPQMGAYEISEKLVKDLKAGLHDFYVVNYANPDMVAHTGNLEATKKAVEITDECIGKVVDATLKMDGIVLITADHGNAEEMLNLRTGDIDKEHSTNPVPFVIVGNQYEGQTSSSGEVPDGDLSLVPPVGMLADVAPTVLSMLGVKKPSQMTGQSLI
ncbi:MAG: 2,3-bisphosphoglycerate-independent phosphoglycerate mutase [Patescibacteria group bacterium]